MGNVNETQCETGSTTINKPVKAFESKKEDDGKKRLISRPKKRNRHSEPIFAPPAKLLQSDISVVHTSESRPPSRHRIRDVDNSEIWISMNSTELEDNSKISATSSNNSLPMSESELPETFDVSAEMSFVNRSDISEFFVAPSLTDLGVVDQVSFAEIPSLTTAMAQIELESFTPEASSNGPPSMFSMCSNTSSMLDTQRTNIGLQSLRPIATLETLSIREILVQDNSVSPCQSEKAYIAISPSTSGATDINVDITSTTSILTPHALPSSPNVTKSHSLDPGNSVAKSATSNNISREPTIGAPVPPETRNSISCTKLPENIPPLVTYADATNLAVRFPEIASQVLSHPLLSLPPIGPHETVQVVAPRTDVLKIPHTAASPNWAAAPLEPEDAPSMKSTNSRSRRRPGARNKSPPQDEGNRRHNGRNHSSMLQSQYGTPAGLGSANQVETHRTQGDTPPKRKGSGFVNTPRFDVAARPFVPGISHDRQEPTRPKTPGPQSAHQQTKQAPATQNPKIPKTTINEAKETFEEIIRNRTNQVTVSNNTLSTIAPTPIVEKVTRVARQTPPAKAFHQETNGRTGTAITDSYVPKPVAGKVPRPTGGEGTQTLKAISCDARSTLVPSQVPRSGRETPTLSTSISGPGKSERAVTFGSTVVIPVVAKASRSVPKRAQVFQAGITSTTITQDSSGGSLVHPLVQDSHQAIARASRRDQPKSSPVRSRSRSPASGPPGKRARRSHSPNREGGPKSTNPRTRSERHRVRKQQVAGISAAARRHLEGSAERKTTSNSSSRRHTLNSDVVTNYMSREDRAEQNQPQNQSGTSRADLHGPISVSVSQKSLKSVEPEDPSVTARAPGSGDSPFKDIHLRAGSASPVPHRSPGATKGASVDQRDSSTNSIQRSPYIGSPLAPRENDANFQAVDALKNASFELSLTSANDWLPPRPTQSIPESDLSSVIEPTIPTMPYTTPLDTSFKTRTKSRSVSLQVPKSPISWRRNEPLIAPAPFGLDPNDVSTPSWLVPPSFFTPDPTSGKYIVKGRLSAEGLEKYPGLPPARSRKSLPSQASMDVSPSSQGAPFKFGKVDNGSQKAVQQLFGTIPGVSRSVSMKVQRSRT